MYKPNRSALHSSGWHLLNTPSVCLLFYKTQLPCDVSLNRRKMISLSKFAAVLRQKQAEQEHSVARFVCTAKASMDIWLTAFTKLKTICLHLLSKSSAAITLRRYMLCFWFVCFSADLKKIYWPVFHTTWWKGVV